MSGNGGFFALVRAKKVVRAILSLVVAVLRTIAALLALAAGAIRRLFRVPCGGRPATETSPEAEARSRMSPLNGIPMPPPCGPAERGEPGGPAPQTASNKKAVARWRKARRRAAARLQRLLARKRPAKRWQKARGRAPALRERRLLCEPLEERRLLSVTATLVNNNLMLAGDAIGNDSLSVQASGQNIQLIDSGSGNVVTTAIAGASGSGTANVTIPMSALTAQSQVIFNGNGNGGSDSFTYNLAGGKLGFTVVVASATSVTVNENVSAAQTIAIQQDAATFTETDVTSGSADLVALANPAASLTVDGGTGTNTVNVNGFGTGFNAGLTINAASTGSSAINFNTSLSPAANNGLTLSSDAISVLDAAAIALTGTGAASLATTRSIYFDPGTSLSVANGNLTMNASPTTVAANFIGIDLNGATIETSGTGNISLSGKSGSSGTSSSNPGVRLRNGAVLASTSTTPGAAGSITVTATETTTSTVSGSGLDMTDSGTKISSDYGNVSLTGTGGSGGSGQGGTAGVLVVNSAKVASIGTGSSAATITVNASTGNNYQTSVGMHLSSSAVLQTVDGNVSITAAGAQNSGNGARSFLSDAGTSTQSTGAGSITVIGNSGVSSGTNRNGVEVDGSLTSSGSGAVTLNGVWGSTSGSGAGIVLGGSVTTAGNPVTLIGDGVTISSAPNAGSGTVTVQPRTATKPVNIGGNNSYSGTASAGQLGLTLAELNLITAGTILVGGSTAGNVTVSAAITRSAATNLNVTSGGTIGFNAGDSLNADGGNVSLTTANHNITTGDNVTTEVTANNLVIAAGSGTVGTTTDNLRVYAQSLNTSGTTGTINLVNLFTGTPPSVTANPGNQTVTSGNLATFTATANGTPAPSVQWEVQQQRRHLVQPRQRRELRHL